MGKKGDKKTSIAQTAATGVVARLAQIGPVTSRAMFGGYGIFLDEVMFGLVNSAGAFHLRVDATTRTRFEDAGGEAHGRMPYMSVPEPIMASSARLLTWAAEASKIARSARK